MSLPVRIALQTPTFYDPEDSVFAELNARILAVVEPFKRTGTVLSLHPATGMTDMDGFGQAGVRFENDAQILSCMRDVVTDGVDGLISHCFFDCALWPARQSFDIPVAGLAESALELARRVGRRSAILCPRPQYIQAMDDLVSLYGFRDSVIRNRAVRSFGVTETDAVTWYFRDPQRLIDTILPTAIECLAEGADVLIIGCGLVSVLLAQAGVTEVDGVPFIVPIIAAVKAVEGLVDLKRAGMPIKTKAGYWGNLA